MFSSRKSSAPASGGLTKSLRFRSSASAYLSRTPSVASNQTTWTWSGWVKRGNITSGYNTFFSAGDNLFQARFDQTTDDLQIYNYNGSSFQFQFVTTQIFRDPSAWYHIVIAIDTTQATSTNRVKLYVNGSQVTSFSTATYPAQNTNLIVNSVIGHYFGINHGYGSYYDGYLADLYLIDGQQLTPSSFASTNATTGQWSPATYSGTYGTNGFHLTFANTTSLTALGYDTSGNSNNWTTNNISLTAGATYDSMNDYPVASSATAANYAVFNPLVKVYSQPTLSNGNLLSTAPANWSSAVGTIGLTSGKWYWEIVNGASDAFVGICGDNATLGTDPPQSSTATILYYGNTGNKRVDTVDTAYGTAFSTQTIGVALDIGGGTIIFYRNNVSQGSISLSSSTLNGRTIFPLSGVISTTATVNFGQQPFTYTPPSGYNALNTYNLPTPTIAQGNKYMDATLWNGGQTSPFNVYNAGSFQPDFVWAKERSSAGSSRLYDVIRGTGVSLSSNSTGAEGTETNPGVSSFNSNGFTITNTYSPSVAPYLNDTSQTYVGWNWKANGSGSSNTNGSITSTVSANTTAGFSIVTYTTTSSSGNATVGHGLGVAPSMILMKSRNATYNWDVYQANVCTGGNYRLILNSSAALDTGNNPFGGVVPTSSVFTMSQTFYGTGINTVAYCFAPIAGYSAFGSYTGNGSATTGPFIYCGFQPKFIMTKRTNTTGDWLMWDTTRNPYNGLQLNLWANYNSAENNYGSGIWNVYSNGMQPTSNSIVCNNSGDTYIYMAFASNPFAYSNAF